MPLPKYHQIYLVVKEQLLEGQFAEGLPSELALMKRFEVARVTVRRALEMLAQEGLISRRPGRGTVPTAHVGAVHSVGTSTKNAQRTGLLDNLVSISLGTQVKVLELDTIGAPPQVAQALSLNPGDMVQKAVRVRRTRQGPLSHITTYVPAHLAESFGRRELVKEPILVLLEKAGLVLGRAQQRISARLADASTAQALAVPVGSALLAVRRLVYDQADQPIQLLHGLYRPDRYEYEMKLSRVGGIDARVWASSELTAQFL